jgi:hypothetical protein
VSAPLRVAGRTNAEAQEVQEHKDPLAGFPGESRKEGVKAMLRSERREERIENGLLGENGRVFTALVPATNLGLLSNNFVDTNDANATGGTGIGDTEPE